MNTSDLKKWAIDNRIEEKIIGDFHNSVEENEDLSFEGVKLPIMDKENIEVKMESISIRIQDWNELEDENCHDNEFVEVNCLVNESGNKIADYRIIYDFNGEKIDDFVVLKNVYEIMKSKIKKEIIDSIIDMVNSKADIQEVKEEINGMRD